MTTTSRQTNPVSRDSQAFEILVRQHHRRLLAYGQSMIHDRAAVEDLVQDSFVLAYRKLDEFRPDGDFGAWLRGILRLKCLEWLRHNRQVPLAPAVMEQLEATHCQWDGAADDPRAPFAALRLCLDSLPETLGTAVRLFYLEELSGADVAKRLEANAATVRKRLQRARAELGDCIRQRLADESA